MLQDDDLDAAVAAGIVTQAQLDALRAFAIRRRARNAAELADDERFRFLRGFNDVFFAVGIALVGIGSSLFAGSAVVGNLVAALLIWALAELLVRRMRLVLPGILLACFFLFFVFRAVELDWQWVAQVTGWSRPPTADRSMLWLLGLGIPVAIAVKALVCALAAQAFYLRFRLPFALLLMAASLVVLALTASEQIWPGNGELVALLTLLSCGLAVFAVAMSYDVSDPERVTRRSDCAFWLHLLAAPLMVHSLIELVAGATLTWDSPDIYVPAVLVILVLTFIAVSIDRRALFVSALTYLGIMIGSAITGATGYRPADGTLVAAATLSILGAMVLMLGIGWRPLRRLLVRCLPNGVMRRLPPLAPAA